MKEMDITPLKEIDDRYNQSISEMESAFKCEWDDAVHDSYGVFIKQMWECADDVRKVRCKAETLQKEIYELKLAEFLNKADSLCKETDSV